jgi:hypothetical protein
MSRPRRMPSLADTGAGAASRHAPLAGDDYVPPQPTLVLRDGRYVAMPDPPQSRFLTEQDREREIARIRDYDKHVPPGVIQFGIPGMGKALELQAKLLFMAAKFAATKAVQKIVEIRNKNETRREADRQERQENERNLRDAIDRHHERMQDRLERSREQDAIDRGEHRKRIGDHTQVA